MSEMEVSLEVLIRHIEEDPIELPDGRVLLTLADAGHYATALPEDVQPTAIASPDVLTDVSDALQFLIGKDAVIDSDADRVRQTPLDLVTRLPAKAAYLTFLPKSSGLPGVSAWMYCSNSLAMLVTVWFRTASHYG